MERPADFSVMETDGGRRAVLSGDWTATAAGDAVSRLVAAVRGEALSGIDLTSVRRLDTAGAYGILRAVADHSVADHIDARPETHRLLELVAWRWDTKRWDRRALHQALAQDPRRGVL